MPNYFKSQKLEFRITFQAFFEYYALYNALPASWRVPQEYAENLEFVPLFHDISVQKINFAPLKSHSVSSFWPL